MRLALAFLAMASLVLPLRADDSKPASKAIPVITLTHNEPVVYEKEVEPILLNKCAFCHSGNVKEGKFDVSSHETLMKGGKKGIAIVAGKAAESRLIHLAGKTEKPFMPPRGEEPLTPAELALLKLWVDQGARPPASARAKPKVVLGVPPASVHPVHALAVSPDKSAVAVGRGNQIHVYDAGSGTFIRTLVDPKLVGPDQKSVAAAHLGLVESLAYSPDGKFLASGSYGEVLLWDATTGLLRQKLTGFADRVIALAFSANGKLLATGGGVPTEDGEIKVFDAATGALSFEVKSGHSDQVFGVAFSPDGTKLATGAADKFVKVWEVPGGKFIKSFEGHTHHVLDVAWKADGKVLASAGADNTVKVWDFEKGEQVRTIQANGKQVNRLAFIGSTPNFLTCGGDAMVRFWNVDNGGNLRNFGGGGDFLYAVGVSSDGRVVAAGGEEGIVRLYNPDNGQVLKTLGEPVAKK